MKLSDETKTVIIGISIGGFVLLSTIAFHRYWDMERRTIFRRNNPHSGEIQTMKTQNQILREQLKGAEVAMKLKVGMKVEYLCAPGASVQTIIRSEPWKLGHGTFVVKIDGASGGVDCAKITIL